MADRLSPIHPDNLVTLEVGGLLYKGWKTVKIRQAIDQLAGVFSLELHDRWTGQSEAWAIAAGDACTLKIGNTVMITGYVDANKVGLSHTTHTITIDGRDKTGDLVDCSAPPKEWGGQKFEAIALELLKPYGVTLTTQLDTDGNGYKAKGKDAKGKAATGNAGTGGGLIPKKASNSGETVHKLLEKMAKSQAALLVSDRVGGLIITRAGLAGRAADTLVLGKNIKSLNYDRTFANLYSEITVKGQQSGAQLPRSNLVNVEQSAKPVGVIKRADTTAQNAAINRYRPLILMAEEQAGADRCKRRAAWEASTREGKSLKLTIMVQGWRQTNGDIWTVNTLTRVKCPLVREDEDFLITACEFSIDRNNGTQTSLTLSRPSAFDVLPDIPPPSKNTTNQVNLATVKPR